MNSKYLSIVLGGLMLMGIVGLLGCGTEINQAKNQNLVSYSYSYGGGMTGGGGYEEISIINDEAIMTIGNSEWWYEDDTITEYKLDKAVLEEIRAVFNKYKMATWHNKEFTNIFVADGESYSYNFKFDEGLRVHFSSQIYPEKYSKKLDEIDEIIKKYKENASELPGLVVEKTDPDSEEFINHSNPDDGVVRIDVFEYAKNRIRFRVSNGTAEDVEIPDEVKVVRNSDGTVLGEDSSTYPINVSANYANEEAIGLSERLSEGVYTLTVGDYSCEFEIK